MSDDAAAVAMAVLRQKSAVFQVESHGLFPIRDL